VFHRANVVWVGPVEHLLKMVGGWPVHGSALLGRPTLGSSLLWLGNDDELPLLDLFLFLFLFVVAFRGPRGVTVWVGLFTLCLPVVAGSGSMAYSASSPMASSTAMSMSSFMV
jgi:hypothetical protein